MGLVQVLIESMQNAAKLSLKIVVDREIVDLVVKRTTSFVQTGLWKKMEIRAILLWDQLL